MRRWNKKQWLAVACVGLLSTLPLHGDTPASTTPRSVGGGVPLTGGTITATRGPELAPAIGAGTGWTCGAGWDCSVAGTLNKNADGVGTVAPNPAITAVVETTYEVKITLGAVTVGNGATCTMGGTPLPTALTAATTYTQYVKAATTASLICTPTPTGTRFTITSISVKAFTDATGDLTVEGDHTVYGQIVVGAGTTASPAVRSSDADSGFCFRAGSSTDPGLCSNGLVGAYASGATLVTGTSGINTTPAANGFALNRTLTAAGTTGAQTVNKHAGSVNFAAAASTLVVTNSVAAATSLIFLTPQTADATCVSFSAVRAAGSFTITANAACTAETTVAFLVTN